MQSRVQKWGNSLALRIPKSFAQEVGIERDAPVDVSLENGKLVIEPISKPALTLEQLLSQVTEDNIHHEVDTGPVMGEEIW
ncbi:MAG: AbrB/MazE/SpoVT family DNA-binding domain-containing protein [Planctomycetes bacterium]|nr:AbrB/MazE/SpoVT family DNA-binding domain-containing protein [Planctomycetota bacterium]